MKTMKCDICDHEESAESFEEWMGNMKSHYMQAHADFMAKKGELSPEQQQAEMKQWMEDNQKRFEEA